MTKQHLQGGSACTIAVHHPVHCLVHATGLCPVQPQHPELPMCRGLHGQQRSPWHQAGDCRLYREEGWGALEPRREWGTDVGAALTALAMHAPMGPSDKPCQDPSNTGLVCSSEAH